MVIHITIRGIFMLAIIIGGSLCGSLSILTGALYLLYQTSNYILTMLTVKIAQKPPRAHQKYCSSVCERLTAFCCVAFCFVCTTGFILRGVEQYKHPKQIHVRTPLMIISSFICLSCTILYGTVRYLHSKKRRGQR